MTGEGTRGVPVEIEDTTAPPVLGEESQEEKLLDMADIPAADEEEVQSAAAPEEELFVSDSSDQAFETSSTRQTRPRPENAAIDQDPDADDKKKLAMRTSYDGFSIYGRILCLVVKRRGNAKGKDLAGGAGQAMMEEWIASTQMAEGQMLDE
ncbi:MAG: hypothetical protein Q9210_004982 [Variospora velana]